MPAHTPRPPNRQQSEYAMQIRQFYGRHDRNKTFQLALHSATLNLPAKAII
jgi:hypothetical protein